MNKKCMKKPHEKGIFVRLGPVSGQYQIHRNDRNAPTSRGIWVLPIQFANELIWLGGGWCGRTLPNKKEQKFIDEINKHLINNNYNIVYKMLDIKKLDVNHYLSQEYSFIIHKPKIDEIDYTIVHQKQIVNKKFKQHYKRINRNMTDEIWCHLPPKKDIGAGWWWKCSVREYWHRARKYMTINWAPDLYEVFIEM